MSGRIITNVKKMKHNKKFFKEQGKIGADKRWAIRYETLLKLSKYYDKKQQNKFLTWKTAHLVVLLKSIKNNEKI